MRQNLLGCAENFLNIYWTITSSMIMYFVQGISEIRVQSIGEPFPSADFLKNLCEIRNISLDNLFIVPGNHDVNRTASDRENVVENMLWRDNKSWSRNYKTELGNIGDSTLQALHDGEKRV